MARRKRECYLCGKSYEYCSSCSQDRMKPTWMHEFHSEDCKNIFDICTRFNMQLMTKDEAKAALEKCDLSNKENFKAYVQKDLSNIFAEDEKPATKVQPKATKQPKVDAPKVHEVVLQEEENK